MAYNSPVIWGNIYDDKGKPINGGLVKLVEGEEKTSDPLSVIGQTKTDSNGYYEFGLPIPLKSNYHILISASDCVKKEQNINRNSICYY